MVTLPWPEEERNWVVSLFLYLNFLKNCQIQFSSWRSLYWGGFYLTRCANSIPVMRNAKLVQEGMLFTPSSAAKKSWGTPLGTGRFYTTVRGITGRLAKRKLTFCTCFTTKPCPRGTRGIFLTMTLHARAKRWNWMTIEMLRGERSQDEMYFYSKCQAELMRECHLLFQEEYPFRHRVYHTIFGKVKWKMGTGLAFV